VSEVAESKSAIVEGVTFKSLHCEEMSYRISVSRDKFNVDKFRSGLMPKGQMKDRYGTVCAPLDPKTADYHVHADWLIDKDEVNFTIDFESGPKEHEKDEREPYAEQFMEWLGQFFVHESAHAHIHADFVYPIEARQSKFIALPLKTTIGPKGDEAEINGISLTLPSKPEGVLSVWVMRWKPRWRIQLAANRRVTFKGFTPYEDMRAIASIVEMVTEETKS